MTPPLTHAHYRELLTAAKTSGYAARGFGALPQLNMAAPPSQRALGGADGYQQDELLLSAGIQVLYQHFEHPIYPQFSSVTLVRGLSVVDALANIGFESTAGMLIGKG